MNQMIKMRIDAVINNLNQLPTIPDVVSKVINMVNDPNVSFDKMAAEISKDQSMTTNILKLCNSAYFSQGKEITSVQRAIVTLGLKEVKDIVVIAATKSVMDRNVLGYDLAKGELWQQGLAVAILSKEIAVNKGHKELADTVFTGGIIHAVGKTVLALYVHTAFKEIISNVEEKNITFEQAEKEVMGYNHQEIGEKILTKWNFPEVLKAIVRYYLEPQNAPEEYRAAVSIVHIANAIIMMTGTGVGSDGLFYELNPIALTTLKITDDELTEIFSNSPQILEQAQGIM